MKPWTIICDFDGTISVEDVTDALLERYGEHGWRELEEQWRRGDITSRVCMQAQVRLLNVSKPELDAAIDEFRIDPDFLAFVEAARRAGWDVAVVSDGLDYAIHRILARHGAGDLPIHANHLVSIEGNRWVLESPCAHDMCRVGAGTCKCARAQRARSAGRSLMLIGDGASDFCVANEVDLVFAKHRLIEHCRLGGINHVPIVGFGDAIGLLSALGQGFDELAHTFRTDEEEPQSNG